MGKHPVTERVASYWEAGSCGTRHTEQAKYSLDYFEEIEEFRYRHEPFIHSFAQFSRWHGKKILEVGVGAGTDFLQFVRSGAKSFGIDLTQEAIENVRHRLDVYGLEAEDLKQCNAEQLPYEDNYFDLAYSWGVIHHAKDMEAVLAEMHRVVRPGGRIKFMIYNYYSPHVVYMWLRYAVLRGRVWRGPRWAIFHYQESYATKVYTKNQIRKMLKRFPHSDLNVSFWNQRLRDKARLRTIRRFINSILPRQCGWYMAVDCKKDPDQ